MTEPTTVLIVDDDPRVLFATARIAKKAGLTVIEARTGKECLQKAAVHKPDIIVLDVVLPDLDGFEVCRRIKANPELQDTFVLMASGKKISPDEQAEGLQLGADGYLTRPFSNKEFLARLEAIVRIQQTQKEIRQSEAWLKTMLKSISDAVIAADEACRITFINPTAEYLTGWSQLEATDRSCLEVFRIKNGEPDQPIGDLIKNALQAGQGTDFPESTILTTRNGVKRNIAGSVAPFKDGSGAIIGVVLVFRDRTKAHQTLSALRQSEADLKQAQRVAHIGSWRWYIQENRLEWSDEMYRIFGIEKEGFTGNLADVIARAIHPEDRTAVEASNRSVIQNKKPIPLEYRVVWPDGAVRTLWAEAGELILDDDGNPAILTGIVQDITERKEAEATLERERAILNTIIDNIPVLLTRYDPETNLLYFNKEFEDTFGWTTADAAEMDLMEQFYPDPDVRRKAQEYMQQATVEWREFQVHARDGEIIDSEWSNVRLDDGTQIGIGIDVRERKRREQELRQREEQYRLLAENTLDVNWTMNPNLEFTYVNPAITHFSGYTPSEWIGAHLSDHCDAANFAKMVQIIGQEIKRGDQHRGVIFEAEMLHKDSTPVPVEIHGKVLFDDQGAPVKLQGTTRDITERKQAEQERDELLTHIRTQARELQEIIDTVPETVILLDASERVLHVNATAENILAELADAGVGDILTHLGDRSLADLLTSPPTRGLWHEVQGNGRFFEAIARPMSNNSDNQKWVLVVRDVTREREIEKQNQQQERMAAVGQLAAGIAHDFNNIMAVIVLYTQMSMQEPQLPPKVKGRLETIVQQASRATDLIQQILDFGRRSVLEQQPIDLMPFLREMARLLTRTVPENIDIEFQYEEGEYIVHADPTRIQQAVMNLAVNARDAMPQGGELRILLSGMTLREAIRCVNCGELIEGEWVQVQVRDTGSGIPPDVLPHIFEPFFTTKPVDRGTGLGLAQVYGIVKQHEGHIDVTTEVGAGATFTLYLPAFVVPEPERPFAASQETPYGQGETVLIVEDFDEMRQTLADILDLLNYHVLTAAHGQEALALLNERSDEVDLVLSDLVMPVMNGEALFYVLRQQYPAIKIILMTGHPMEKTLQELVDEGLSDYLLKPPQMEILARKVAQALQG